MQNEKYCYHCMEKLEREINFCTNCGKVLDKQINGYQLIPGTILNNRYLVGEELGRGGFGVTYIGRDLNLDIRVAIKEFFPSGFADRNNKISNDIVLSDIEKADFYESQKGNFLNEARSIAKFSEEKGIVDVRDYFEENKTAYIIMEYLDGENLSQYVKRHGLIKPKRMFALMLPIMKSLEKVNSENIIHRDITPENIMVLKDGTVKLMDFGSARYITNRDRHTTVLLKQGYAPEEQYRSDIAAQGPWTDVYGLCATIYRCITGVVPQGALDRLIRDELEDPSKLGVEIEPDLEDVLMYGLALHKENRCRNMKQLRDLTESVLQGLPIPDLRGRNVRRTYNTDSNEIRSHSGSDNYGDDDLYNNYSEDEVQRRYTRERDNRGKTNKGLIITAVILTIAAVIASVVIIATTLSSNKKNSPTTNTVQTVATKAKKETEKQTEKPTQKPTEETKQTETEEQQTEETLTPEPETEEPTMAPVPEPDTTEYQYIETEESEYY